MLAKSKSIAAIAAILTTVAATSLATAPAQAAVVYCKTAGVPKGCVFRPTVPAPIVAAPVAPIAAARVTRIGYAAPVRVAHAGYTRVTPYGVRHVGVTRVWR
jgi:hypothetical protein